MGDAPLVQMQPNIEPVDLSGHLGKEMGVGVVGVLFEVRVAIAHGVNISVDWQWVAVSGKGKVENIGSRV
ncbi:hypothetical protein C7271_22735 [filamentous cyanobacterium CCP5]|nr:hypothetical protein C7271_22735 [filamentous cyanobacterium CCP5]